MNILFGLALKLNNAHLISELYLNKDLTFVNFDFASKSDRCKAVTTIMGSLTESLHSLRNFSSQPIKVMFDLDNEYTNSYRLPLSSNQCQITSILCSSVKCVTNNL